MLIGGMRARLVHRPEKPRWLQLFYALVCGKFIYRTGMESPAQSWRAPALYRLGAHHHQRIRASFAWLLTIEGLPSLPPDGCLERFSPGCF
jgi:hypothetical protein